MALDIEIPTWTHQVLSCPPPPQQFVDLALAADPSLYKNSTRYNYYKPGKDPHAVRQLTKQGDSIQMVRIPRYVVGDEFDQWVRDNLITDFTAATIAISQHGNGGSLGPHADRWRNFVLLYLVQNGGDHARTNFYQQQGQPLIRDKFAIEDDYDSLQLIDSFQIPLNQWVLLNGRILHTVEQIDTVRIAFQIELLHLDEIKKFITGSVLPKCL